ncbi:unnamed protein product [Fusarium venenatum]|uniref:WSC domain-containing protein n=1 Tax=Fusarium venenatum TaxID=56646 RepID=A0A2L2THL7_9HYPO|nr:uncharacterized protein FVRRES_13743 [Fusarium venenatum]CEI41789.1 unnamed protein product [Fusarium venenatum]
MGAFISVTSTYDPAVVAGAIFNGAGVTVQQAFWIRIAEADSSPAGTFSDGPYGIGSGGILTNGLASNAAGAQSPNTYNTFPGSGQYCGAEGFDATVLQVDIDIAEGGRPDPIAIFLDDVLWSIDDSNDRITATSKYLNEEIGINEKDKEDWPFSPDFNRATRYDGSSPPLLVGIPAIPGVHTMVFAVCDAFDGQWDSALMVKAKGCKDCNPQVQINYVSTTTTTGSTSFTSTTKAIGTESGTVLFGVPEETTTTIEDVTTTTTDASTTGEPTTPATEISTTDVFSTTTITEIQETSTATSDTDPTDTTTMTSDQSSTVTSTVDSTSTSNTETSATTDIGGTTTSSGTTDIASSSIQSFDESSTLDTSTWTTSSFIEPGSTSSEGSTSILESSTMTEQRTVSRSIASLETPSASSEVSTGVLPITTTKGGSDAQTTSDTVNPTNLEVIGSFTFLGCFGSPDGYPSFDLIATSDDMTPSNSCYASDSLESTNLVGEGQCDTPCPNAPLLFCGGLIGAGGTSIRHRRSYRRDAPSNVLLTLYGATDTGDTSSNALITGTSTAPSISETIGEASVSTEDATVIGSITSDSAPGVVTQPTASSFELPITSGHAIPFPPNRPVPTSGWLGKNNMTQVVDPVITVSTITYTVVDPNNPSTFKVEEYCSTIQYYPCRRCEKQDIPEVHMTTIQRQCNACGLNGENSVYLTVPAAVAAPSATDRFKHPGYPPQHGSEPFVASPIETGIRHPKPVIQAKPTKAHHNPIPPISEEEDSPDVPVRLNDNEPQGHPQDDFPKKPQVEAPKAPVNEPKPVDQAHPTSQFVGGYEIKTTTLPTWHVPSEVPVIVSTATSSLPIFGMIFFVFALASMLNSV